MVEVFDVELDNGAELVEDFVLETRELDEELEEDPEEEEVPGPELVGQQLLRQSLEGAQ